ncbi:MAG: metallophosphoesterase [Patescibacteria group bacterium]|jgi:predicted MPP superfamily phosphohydrolase|nr:metallophosphoesterase [Patescibacteria group bacterium]MDD4443615.1 metallophosphoesterase [Patescibacteria group bacterium]NCU39315.1 metallophosphoesterase [Candidatus Falkowbacteria bacterium]
MMQLIIFAVSAIFLFCGHILGWFVCRDLFALNYKASIISGLIFLFLFLSIVISSYLIHKKDNVIVRSYYILAGVWTGILVNFILISLAAYLFNFLFPAIFINKLLLPGIVLFTSLILSVLGVFKAFFAKVKYYKVKIKDLPEYWWNKEIVQISDIHLGPVYRKNFLQKTIKKINKLEPELVCITGDLFDGMESGFSWLNNPFSQLKTKQGIYYSFGNHDFYLGFNRVKKLLSKTPLTILDNKMKEVLGLQIIGINYSFNKDFDLNRAILEQVGYDPKKASLLLYHEPRNIDLAIKAGIDLQLSGHTHRGQLFPFNYLAKIAYKGYDAGFFNKGNFNLIINSGLGTWGPPMRTSGRGEISLIKLMPLK